MDAYRRYGPALVRKCRRMLQHSAEPEDLVTGSAPPTRTADRPLPPQTVCARLTPTHGQ